MPDRKETPGWSNLTSIRRQKIPSGSSSTTSTYQVLRARLSRVAGFDSANRTHERAGRLIGCLLVVHVHGPTVKGKPGSRHQMAQWALSPPRHGRYRGGPDKRARQTRGSYSRVVGDAEGAVAYVVYSV